MQQQGNEDFKKKVAKTVEEYRADRLKNLNEKMQAKEEELRQAKKVKGQGFQFSLPKTKKPKEVPSKPLVVIKPKDKKKRGQPRKKEEKELAIQKSDIAVLGAQPGS